MARFRVPKKFRSQVQKWTKYNLRELEKLGQNVGKQLEKSAAMVFKRERLRFLHAIEKHGLGRFNYNTIKREVTRSARKVATTTLAKGKQALNMEIRRATGLARGNVLEMNRYMPQKVIRKCRPVARKAA